MRTLYDNEGRSWRVWHVRPQSGVLKGASPELANGWLCFESDSEKRRLAEPRVDWESIADDELLALLAEARSVVKATA
ncbi:hypothetical protein [Longimicrobium sp.]|uniref:hypothetical protein n=1 Tax=Longimicrobium sp. TaxID=2029185 RepID=UPI002B6F6D7F|nr:hypothetical protein [Longimicrobium sp.]HSU17884.1 hypothetical protein [Longimicrobium sp.]